MRLNYPEILPITSHKDEIVKAIEENQVVIVVGETGSGKSTQIPKMILEALSSLRKTDYALGEFKIACTQPRRIAAVSIATWMAQETEVDLGQEVGYKIRFDDDTTAGTIINICTDGILLQEMKGDGLLSRYDAILVDEAHERNLNIDFLLGLLKDIQGKRLAAGLSAMKILVTSATFDAGKFADFFAELNVDSEGRVAPIPLINVSGRLYPVEIVYDPLEEGEEPYGKIARLIKGIASGGGGGDVLVFMPGEAEIFKTIRAVEEAAGIRVKCLPLYSRLSMDEQELIYLDFPGQTKVVVATNIAETSLTVPGIKYVIDSGLARMTDFNFRTGIGSLEVKNISQASAIQRAGRAGRVEAGHCIRLYAEADFQAREKYTQPEIQRSDLSSVVLHMRLIGIANLTGFSFIDAPEPKAFRNAIANLIELGALDEAQNLTPLGVKMAHLPLEPRISAMLLAAEKYGCVREVAIIASSLSVKDPFLRPNGEEEEADRAKRYFQRMVIGAGAKYRTVRIRRGRRVFTRRVRDRDQHALDLVSDLMVFLVIWNKLQALKDDLQRELFCQSNYLNHLLFREIGQIYRQLLDTLNIFAKDEFSRYLLVEGQTDLSVDLSKKEGILKSISSGFIQNLCEASSPQTYRTRTVENVMIHPGSALFNLHPKFFVSAEIVETTRLYARNNTVIDIRWLEEIAPQLCRVRSGPIRFDRHSGRVVREEEVYFRGQRIVRDRLVEIGQKDPAQAEEILVREGLVKRGLISHYPWLKKNQETVAKLKAYAARLNEPRWALTDMRLREWYLRKLRLVSREPVASLQQLDRLLAGRGEGFLLLNEEEILTPAERKKLARLFPESVYLAGKSYPVDYRYDEHAFPGRAVIVLKVADLIDLSGVVVTANLREYPELHPWFVVRAADVGEGVGERDSAADSAVIAEGGEIDSLKEEVDLWHLKKKLKKVRRQVEVHGIRLSELWHYLPTVLEPLELGSSLFGAAGDKIIYVYSGFRLEGKKVTKTVFGEEETARNSTVAALKASFELQYRNLLAFAESQILALEKGHEQYFYQIDCLEVLQKGLWARLGWEEKFRQLDKLNNVVLVKACFSDFAARIDALKSETIAALQKYLSAMDDLARSEKSVDLQKLSEMKKNLEGGLF